MKKILLTIVSCSIALVSCDKIDSILDTTNYSKYDTSNFPTSEKDANQIVNSIYNALTYFLTDPENSNIFRNMVASDDMFGGGSTSNTGAQATDRLMEKGNDESQKNWGISYNGIFRANYALQVIPEMDDALFSSLDAKNYLIGQAYFLRAWYNWELAEKFETFPLVLTSEAANIPRASVEEIYKSLADDFTSAINYMPAKYKYSKEDGFAGRATKYAAEAVLARVWMFYTGFYGKNDMFGITKSDIVKYLEDVRDNSNFGLVDDPRNIWPYTNEYSSGLAYNTDFGTYPNREGLKWEGNLCKETIWCTHFSLVYYESGSCGYNRMGEYFGLRNKNSEANVDCYPFGIGYTNGTVNSKMVQEWAEDPDYGRKDKRLWGSVMVVDNADERYEWLEKDEVELPNHPGNDSKEVEKTLFHNKKYMVSTCYSDASKSNIYENFFYAAGANKNSNQYGNRNDAIHMRYADVLLMLDELNGTVVGMNALRKRAGLDEYKDYSFEKLQKERRYELAFEGVRFSDLRRWYPEKAGEIIAENQKGAFIEYRGNAVPGGWADETKSGGIAKRYSETRGFWKISSQEISLSENVLEETPGWEAEKRNQWLFGNGSLPYPTSY